MYSISAEDVPIHPAAEPHGNPSLKSQRMSYAPKDAQSVAAPSSLEARGDSLGEDGDKARTSDLGDSEDGEMHEYVIGCHKSDRSGSDDTTDGARSRLQSEDGTCASATIEEGEVGPIDQGYMAETRPGNSLDKGVIVENGGFNDEDQLKANVNAIKLPPGELGVDTIEGKNPANKNQGLDFVVC